MKIIFISGPSGSGKTTLSKQLIEKIKNGLVLSTDNYYKTGLKSKLLSKIIKGYFDRSISFNYKLFKNDFYFILKNETSMIDRSYNFENKTRKNSLNKKNNIKCLIIEGIFAKEFSRTLNNQNYIFFELKINKEQCMQRVLDRDLKERGKPKKQASKDFLISWDLYQKRFKNNKKDFIITKNTNIDHIIKIISN